MPDLSDLELLDALGVEAKAKKKVKLTPKQERIIAGFEEIQRFVEDHGHAPKHGEDKDIFERLYATRLDRIRKLPECRELVEDLDTEGLLEGSELSDEAILEDVGDDELLAQLGVEAQKSNDITELKHVKSQAQKEREKADEVGTREPCKDFDNFKPMFESVQADLKTGLRKTLPFNKDGSIEEGNWFILGGQKALVADVGDQFIGTDGRKEYRLRVIFDNGVESNQLMRSLQKRLWEDETGRRISDTSYGPLFDDVETEEDLASGTIYVLRSKLDHPVINQSRDVIHKIGVTGGEVKKRIANAKNDPTYLMADVEIVATYELFNINRKKLEALIHRFFDNAKMEIEIKDRFGKPVVPQEWFLVPLFVIDEVVEKIKDKTISEYKYDIEKASLVSISNNKKK
ncbi:T5orf172 domain protein [Marinomonas gallaica]|uniref:T5orf172 domain protein n=1 Tax=Marinomonas gallaica TaxID=1806667 RepID=A0A1C3JR72_9GAMM|nr:GIY-YIG nuclease family protein [Marinomonas gallaica]SBT17703.1 T5orf172 domain protein [Marinomonas gallaica]SBT20029.1 T5orf172 domain protein [Marinomonas gallaica]